MLIRVPAVTRPRFVRRSVRLSSDISQDPSRCRVFGSVVKPFEDSKNLRLKFRLNSNSVIFN